APRSRSIRPSRATCSRCAASATGSPTKDASEMKSLRARVLMLLVGFGLLMAAMLAAIMYSSVREYYNDWIYDKSASFAERILEAHPNLWRDYERDPGSFGQQLRQYTLYAPNTGLYLVDPEGKVLASAGDARQFWG